MLNTQRKRDILTEKRVGTQKRDFQPESGNVDTYVTHDLLGQKCAKFTANNHNLVN